MGQLDGDTTRQVQDAHLSGAAVVDVHFRLHGLVGPAVLIPADHGYALFGALSRLLPWLHGSPLVGVHPIRGQLVGNRALALTPASTLAFRVPVTVLPGLLPLAGQSIDLEGTVLRVGLPHVRALRPSPVLSSRLVTIKGMLEPDAFLEAARRQLAELGVDGQPALLERAGTRAIEGRGAAPSSPWIRRTLRVRDKEVVGYALRVAGLSPEASIRLQIAGLGGRRRFGCGIFLPERTSTPTQAVQETGERSN
ncbi:CRISPR-associated endonuclease Cas6 [bacterium HR29]|jgi:CRISPR-associated protein Cas6|nr:CRISPR-associated endonuclease Cas6 [bacterium HR29]